MENAIDFEHLLLIATWWIDSISMINLEYTFKFNLLAKMLGILTHDFKTST